MLLPAGLTRGSVRSNWSVLLTFLPGTTVSVPQQIKSLSVLIASWLPASLTLWP